MELSVTDRLSSGQDLDLQSRRENQGKGNVLAFCIYIKLCVRLHGFVLLEYYVFFKKKYILNR